MYNGILLSHKKNEILLFATVWMNLEGIMLSEIKSNREKQRPFNFTYMWNLKNNQKMNKHNKRETESEIKRTNRWLPGNGR